MGERPAWDAEGAAVSALHRVVVDFGAPVLGDPARLRNLLSDLLPDDVREARLLAAAAEAGVASALQRHLGAGLSPDDAVSVAAGSLAEAYGLAPPAAMWAVAAMAVALGYPVTTASTLGTRPPRPAGPPGIGPPTVRDAAPPGPRPARWPSPAPGPSPLPPAPGPSYGTPGPPPAWPSPSRPPGPVRAHRWVPAAIAVVALVGIAIAAAILLVARSSPSSDPGTTTTGGSSTAAAGTTALSGPVYVDRQDPTTPASHPLSTGLAVLGGRSYPESIFFRMLALGEDVSVTYRVPAGAHTLSVLPGLDDTQASNFSSDDAPSVTVDYLVSEGSRVLDRVTVSGSDPIAPQQTVALGDTGSVTLEIDTDGPVGDAVNVDWAQAELTP